MKDYVIFHIHSGTYWRPNSAGYTHSIYEAGLYTEFEAKKTERSTHGDHVALPVKEAVEKHKLQRQIPHVEAMLAVMKEATNA